MNTRWWHSASQSCNRQRVRPTGKETDRRQADRQIDREREKADKQADSMQTFSIRLITVLSVIK